MKMRFGSYVAAGFVASLAMFSGTANARQLHSTWNTAACGFTDHSGFMLRRPTHLAAIELWYHWGRRESAVGYELYQKDRLVKRGRLERATCDEYQEAWCLARADIGADLQRGFVEVRVERPKVCQNDESGGEGFIRAFGRSD